MLLPVASTNMAKERILVAFPSGPLRPFSGKPMNYPARIKKKRPKKFRCGTPPWLKAFRKRKGIKPMLRRVFGDNHVNDKREYYRTVYLKSNHWKELRKLKLSTNPSCEDCGSSFRLEPHHLQYKNLYDVEVSDLKTLCRKCHKK